MTDRSGWAEVLARAVRGPVERNVALSGMSTFRIGGPASVLLSPASAEDVAESLRLARRDGVGWMALGLGSNVLFSDLGFDGLVIRPGPELASLDRTEPGPSNWYAGAGLPTPLLARRTARAGAAGLHRLIGVPGAVGGGVAMNAGAHGQDYSQAVRSVDLVTEEGAVESRPTGAISWAYRNSHLGRVVVLGCALELTEADPAQLNAEVGSLLQRRRAGTPFDRPCCGSVFRNPADAPEGPDGNRMTAGQLIEAAGLKGRRRGGAEVSMKHANYIVNVEKAGSADVVALIDEVRARVFQVFGVELELEVKVIPGGDKG